MLNTKKFYKNSMNKNAWIYFADEYNPNTTRGLNNLRGLNINTEAIERLKTFYLHDSKKIDQQRLLAYREFILNNILK
jgi:hypothetical protein